MLIDDKKLIIQKLKQAIPEARVEENLNQLMTDPEGRILVLYAGANYAENSEIPLTARWKSKRWTIAVTVRDPLKNDIALKYLEKIRASLQGFKLGIDDRERIYPENERFEQFMEGLELFSYKIDFVSSEVAQSEEVNID